MALDSKPTRSPRHTRRVPEHSVLYRRLIPILLLLFALLTILIVVVSLGILFGVIKVQ